MHCSLLYWTITYLESVVISRRKVANIPYVQLLSKVLIDSVTIATADMLLASNCHKVIYKVFS